MGFFKILSVFILTIATLRELTKKDQNYDRLIYTAFPTVTMWLIVMGVE